MEHGADAGVLLTISDIYWNNSYNSTLQSTIQSSLQSTLQLSSIQPTIKWHQT